MATSAVAAVARPADGPNSAPAAIESPAKHFRLLDAADAVWAASAGQVLESAFDRFYLDFARLGFAPQPIQQPLVWVCFSRRDHFEGYGWDEDGADVSRLSEYYSPQTNRVAVLWSPAARAGLTTPAQSCPRPGAAPEARPKEVAPLPLDRLRLVHEAAHQLSFSTGLLRRNVIYPLWVCEGFATAFEAGGLDAENPNRQNRLLDAFRRGQLEPLESFAFRTGVPDGDAATARAYAESWGLFRFLMREHGDQLRRYLAALPAGGASAAHRADLRAAFVESFGPTDVVERQWHEHLAALATPAAPAKVAAGASVSTSSVR